MAFETTGRGLTFPEASVARPDPAWFQVLRASARRAWGGIDDDSGGSGGGGVGDLGVLPAVVDRRTGSGGDSVSNDSGRGGGGGGWVPVGARAVGAGRAEVDGEGALVPEFDAKTAVRMARELFTEIAAGKEAGR